MRAPHLGFSQLATSFFACPRLGILRAPLLRLVSVQRMSSLKRHSITYEHSTSYALHLTFRQTKTRRLCSSWRSIIDMQLARSKCLADDRSSARILRAKNCSIQTLIFNHQSASYSTTAAACSQRLLFRSPRATKDNKIRVFVNSQSSRKSRGSEVRNLT